jgi:hypothetical protein
MSVSKRRATGHVEREWVARYLAGNAPALSDTLCWPG